MPDQFLKYPTITEPTQDIKSIQQSIGQIKEICEMLTGQRGPTEYSIQEGLSKIERVSDKFGASIRDLTEIAADATGAYAQRISILEAEMTAARQGQTSVSARITQVDTARVTGDSGLATRATNLETEVTNARGGLGTLSAKITNVASVAASANATTASTVSSLTTTVGSHTGSISTLTSSVDGISVQKVVKATLDGSTGGYALTGVQNADGSGAVFTFEINANAVVNGSLVVHGSIDTDQVAGNAITRAALSATNTNYFDDVTVTLRAGAVALVIGMIKGDQTTYGVPGDLVMRLRVKLGAGAFTDMQIANVVNDRVTIGGAIFYSFQTTTIMDYYTVPSDGSYTFRVISGNTNAPGAAITVLETVR